MYCPKCGQQNPENGKYCRSCGTDLGNVSTALNAPQQQLFSDKGKPLHIETAVKKIFSGLAFVAVAIALAFTIGRGWWFWMLIPAFTALGTGIAQYMAIRRAEKGRLVAVGHPQPGLEASQPASLRPAQPEFASPESRYKTGDLVPPSVTDSTTRHLEINSEGKTAALPHKD